MYIASSARRSTSVTVSVGEIDPGFGQDLERLLLINGEGDPG